MCTAYSESSAALLCIHRDAPLPPPSPVPRLWHWISCLNRLAWTWWLKQPKQLEIASAPPPPTTTTKIFGNKMRLHAVPPPPFLVQTGLQTAIMTPLWDGWILTVSGVMYADDQSTRLKARWGGSRCMWRVSPCPTAPLASSWSSSMAPLAWKCSLHLLQRLSLVMEEG